jgi:hypothetical protein
MNIETFLKALIVGMIIALAIVTFAKADVYVLARYQPVGAINWHYNGGQDWVYTKTNLQAGIGWVNQFDNGIKLSTRQYVVFDDQVGATGITGNVVLSLASALKFKYEYNYRWYDGSLGDYGYGTGNGMTHKVQIDLEIPII